MRRHSSRSGDRRRVRPAFRSAAAIVTLVLIVAACGSGESSETTFDADTATTSGNNVTSAPVSVVAPGTKQWTDTGIDLSINDRVLIEADGAVTPSANVEDLYGPDGVADRPSAHAFNVVGMREANHASLIGRIGEAGAPFLVGSQLLSTADTDGRLFLGINDTDVGNNAGEFTATITVNPS